MERDLLDFYQGKKVLITGGLGFIGSNLAHALVEAGAVVTLYDGLIDDLGGNFFNIEAIKDSTEVVIANLGDRESAEYHCTGKDIIFNLGMQSSHLDSMKEPFYDLNLNVVSQLHFLESIRKVNPEIRIIYVGSRAQYGKVKTFPINEDTLLFPADIYAAGKQVVEWYHLLYQNICGLRPTSIRLGNTYGPRHQMRHAKYGVQNYLMRIALEGGDIQIYGDGTQLREMIFIDDVTDALLRLARENSCIGQYYCIGSDEKISFLELVQKIIEVCGSGSYHHVEWPEERQVIEVGDVNTDFTKLTEATGWKPETSLKDGLTKTISFYRQFREHYW